MEALIVLLFVVGYAFIALEYRLHIDKAATAILIGSLSWVFLYTLPLYWYGHVPKHTEEALFYHLGEAAEVLFFLVGAMTIVEVVDSYSGFQFLLRILRARTAEQFLGMIVLMTFFLSAVVGSFTTTLLMVALLQKSTPEEARSLRLVGASLVVLAANAGGAWSPLGDITTTMLWIKGRITEVGLVRRVFLPSLLAVLVPFIFLKRIFRGLPMSLEAIQENGDDIPRPFSLLVFIVGIGGILMVPVLRVIFQVPPYLAMLLAMGLIWLVTEIFYRRLHRRVDEPLRLRAVSALERIDTPSLLFFLGILLAVGALSEIGVLRWTAQALEKLIGNLDLTAFFLGILSAIVDNVPLMAAAIEMYPLTQFPTDHQLWEFLAYTVGVGGNILIIGSAPGVIAMGMERIDFLWYLRRISGLAFLGYSAGALVYILLTELI